jgi:uncharacterized membrane protein
MNAGTRHTVTSTHAFSKFTWLALIVAFAFLIRVIGIGSQSLWIDEVATARLVTLGSAAFIEQLFGTVGSEANQPLYFLLLHPWTYVFGTSEWALRAPSLLFGIASIPVFFIWCKGTIGEPAARIATLLLATSAFAVWYSQDARPYSLMLLVACSIQASFSKYMRDRTVASLLVLALVEVVALHTSILFFGLVAFVNLYWLIRRHEGSDSYQWLVTQAAVALLCTPFAILNLVKVAGGAHTQTHADLITAAIYGFWTLLVGFGVGPSVAELHEQEKLEVVLRHIGEVAVIAMVLTAFVLIAVAWLWRSADRLYWILAVSIPAFFVLAVFALLDSTPLPRYWVACLPPVLAILGSALERLQTWARVSALLLLVIVNLISIGRVATDPRYMKDDFRALAQHLAEVRRGAAVFVVGPVIVLEHYGASDLLELRDAPDRPSSGQLNTPTIRAPYWVVVDRTRAWQWDPRARLMRLVVPNGSLPESSYSNVDLYFVDPQ